MQERYVSIKDDVNYVKKELSGDEKVLESAFKIETLYKKHKFKIWGIVIAIILFFAGSAIQKSMHEAKLMKANQAFVTLQKNPDDSTALATLKENNQALYELYSYALAVKKEDIHALEELTNSKNSVISDVSAYTAGVLKRNPVNSVLYKEMSLFEEAYLAIQKGDKKTANEKLELIDERSALSVIAGFLKHSLIKAN